MMTGYHVGAVATALIGILVVADHGWRPMFVMGAIPALVLVPLMFMRLPESPAFLKARGMAAKPADVAGHVRAPRRNPISALFHHGLARSTIAFWVT